ncbi:unnamed protein product [Linum trigynum]|uniref:Uncharacterized protein n=1 Tax=Linum trigynum TaxID=586398 RepID=A0AAV2GRA1_9ROSI
MLSGGAGREQQPTGLVERLVVTNLGRGAGDVSGSQLWTSETCYWLDENGRLRACFEAGVTLYLLTCLGARLKVQKVGFQAVQKWK